VSLLTRARSWLYSLFHRSRLDRDLHEELRHHIESYAADLEHAGFSRKDAERRARAEFGSVAAVAEECRQSVGLRVLDELHGDLRHALRGLARSPAFTAVAVLSLGLGIGANIAIFTLIDAVLLRPLPVHEPQRLFFVDNTGGRSNGANAPPYPCYQRLRDHSRYFSGLAAFDGARFMVTIDAEPEEVRGQYASGNFFAVLGVQAAYGRVFTPLDDSEIGRSGRDAAVALISHAFWQRRFAMSPSVLGRTLHVGAHQVTIVGVTPPGFSGLDVGSPVDLIVPMALRGDDLRDTQSWWFSVVGRLDDQASVEAARADLDAMFQAYLDENGVDPGTRQYFSHIVLVPASKGLNALRSEFSRPLLTVMAIVALVLLIGCANVANLLLARGSARRNEIAIRLAIGASRGRLIRQMITEGAALMALCAVAGLLFGRWTVTLLVGFLAGVHDRVLLEPQFDGRILAFTAAVAVLTGLLFSVAPAVYATRLDAAKPGEGTRTTMAKRHARAGRALVVVQVMFSLVLLCGAALFVRTLHNLSSVRSGFDGRGVLTLRVALPLPLQNPLPAPADGAAERASLGERWADLIFRLGGLPSVQSASASTLSPLSGRDRGVNLTVVGPHAGADSDRSVHLNQVTSGYFDTFGIETSSGRPFTRGDRATAARVAIVNNTAARAYFGDESPLGRRISFGPRVPDEYEIVGVVQDARYEDLRMPAERMVYVPLHRPIDRTTSVTIAMRSSGDVSSLVAAARHSVRQAMPGSFITGIATVGQQTDETLMEERLVAMLASSFGVLALMLACIGLYGVMSYAVVRRRREIGIRLAIGAQRQSVAWMVLRETLALVAAGLALGVPAVWALSGYLESQLFGVAPHDPLALAGAAVVLGAVAFAAGYVPAWRASRVDPAIALRYE
jgi:predicted permease